jgi:hypothetical protein
MTVNFDRFDFGKKLNSGLHGRKSGSRVLLREPERCLECGKVFLSLYALKSCGDHEGLEGI